MSLWEFNSCVEGYVKANSSDDELPPPPTPEEFEAMKQARARRLN